MAVRKLSQIAAAGAIVGTDTIVGVQGGTTDVQYTVSAMAAAVLSVGNGVTAASTLTSGRIPMGDGARGLVDTGAATIGTSLAINGATIGSNALAVSGTSALSGQVTSALGTITTSQPFTITETWNSGGVAFNAFLINVTNTASAATSTFMDFQQGGTSLVRVINNSGVAALQLTRSASNASFGQIDFSSGTLTFSTSTTGLDYRFYDGAKSGAQNGFTILPSAHQAGFQSGGILTWSNSPTDAGQTTQTTISSPSAGVVNIGTTTNNALGSINLTNLTGTGTLIFGTTDASASSGSGALQITGGGSVAKRFWLPAITASAGLQTAVLCQSSGGEVIADSVACLASSARFKTLLGGAESGALGKIIRVPIHRWKYNRDPDSVFPDNYYSEHIGPTAEDIEAIDKRLVGRDKEGKARSISTDQLLALTIQALQEQQEQIEELKKLVA